MADAILMREIAENCCACANPRGADSAARGSVGVPSEIQNEMREEMNTADGATVVPIL
jgi:hypothetical protein